MPDKIYDYTAAGLSIVTSLKGEVSWIINDKKLGILYEAGNAEDLAEKLEYLVVNQEIRKGMAKNSYNIAMDYDCHVQYRKFVDLVDQVCCKQRTY
jgi:glycosyltransferase involved in cell wall biosynthesis